MIDCVINVTPAVFGRMGIFGGAERYVHAVASALQLSGVRRQKIVAFTDTDLQSRNDQGIEIDLIPTDHHSPNRMEWFGRSLWETLSAFKIVYVHQAFTKCVQAALVAASDLGKTIVATDLGGAMPPSSLADHPVRLADRMVAISEFSASLINNNIDMPIDVVGGPVDPNFVAPLMGKRRHGVLSFGRLLPHKGVSRQKRCS